MSEHFHSALSGLAAYRRTELMISHPKFNFAIWNQSSTQFTSLRFRALIFS